MTNEEHKVLILLISAIIALLTFILQMKDDKLKKSGNESSLNWLEVVEYLTTDIYSRKQH